MGIELELDSVVARSFKRVVLVSRGYCDWYGRLVVATTWSWLRWFEVLARHVRAGEIERSSAGVTYM